MIIMTISKKDLDDTMSDIEKSNQVLWQFTQGSVMLEDTPRKKWHRDEMPEFETIRQHATGLSTALKNSKCQIDRCWRYHIASLRLEIRLPNTAEKLERISTGLTPCRFATARTAARDWGSFYSTLWNSISWLWRKIQASCEVQTTHEIISELAFIWRCRKRRRSKASDQSVLSHLWQWVWSSQYKIRLSWRRGFANIRTCSSNDLSYQEESDRESRHSGSTSAR